MRAQPTRGTHGRPETIANAADDNATERRIKEIFKARYRMLSALFPADGDTMVNRACAAAVNASREVDKKGGLRLGSATPEAIAEKVIAAHHLGLEIGDQAYLVPYGSELQLIVGPRGMIALMFRSGFVKSVHAGSVFEGDVFDYDLGSSPFVRHKKSIEGRRAGHITHAYAILETTTEGRVIEVLTWEDLDFYRSFSKATSGPWFDNFEGMCRKTVLKRIAEYVPRSPMLAAALRENDHGAYEIPEEIMRAARGKIDGSADMPQTAPAGEVVPPVSHVNGAAVSP